LIKIWNINAPQGRIPCAIFTKFAEYVRPVGLLLNNFFPIVDTCLSNLQPLRLGEEKIERRRKKPQDENIQ